MKKVQLGLLLGAAAGIIDVIPMILQGLTWDANISAFLFWIVVGFIIATSKIGLRGALKGLAIAIVLLIPLIPLIGWSDPIALIPVASMTFVLGALLGYLIDRYGK